MSDSPRPSFLGAGMPARPLSPEAPVDDRLDAPLDGQSRVDGQPQTVRSQRSTRLLLVGLGTGLVALLCTAWWALSPDASSPVALSQPAMTVIEPDQSADAPPPGPSSAQEEAEVSPEAPVEPAPDVAAVDSSVVDEPVAVDVVRPGAAIAGHSVSAELCEALAAMMEASSTAVSTDGLSQPLLSAYAALGEVPSPYQSTYRDFATLLSEGSIPSGAPFDAFTEAVRIDQMTCL